MLFFGLKPLLIRGLEAEFRLADLKDFPGANLEQLQKQTSEYEVIGFTHIVDFTAIRPRVKIVTGFSRLFFNLESSCSASILQIFNAQGKWLCTNSVISSDLEQGWTVAMTDYRPLAASWLLRHPRVIGRHLPKASPADLLSAHLTLRQQIVNDLSLRILPPTSFEAHIGTLRQQASERRKLVSGKSRLTCAREFLAAKLRPKYEWLGDYPQLASQKRNL